MQQNIAYPKAVELREYACIYLAPMRMLIHRVRVERMKRNTQHEVRENLPLLCAENQTFGSYLKANEGEVACFLLFYVLENRR